MVVQPEANEYIISLTYPVSFYNENKMFKLSQIKLKHLPNTSIKSFTLTTSVPF